MTHPTIIRVTFSHEWQSWGVTPYDADDNQIGEDSDWHPRLSEAKADAETQAGPDTRIELYYRDGGLKRSYWRKRRGYE